MGGEFEWRQYVNEAIDGAGTGNPLFDEAQLRAADPATRQGWLDKLQTSLKDAPAGEKMSALQQANVTLKVAKSAACIETLDEAQRQLAIVRDMIHGLLDADAAAKLVEAVDGLVDRARKVDKARAQVRLETTFDMLSKSFMLEAKKIVEMATTARAHARELGRQLKETKDKPAETKTPPTTYGPLRHDAAGSIVEMARQLAPVMASMQPDIQVEFPPLLTDNQLAALVEVLKGKEDKGDSQPMQIHYDENSTAIEIDKKHNRMRVGTRFSADQVSWPEWDYYRTDSETVTKEI